MALVRRRVRPGSRPSASTSFMIRSPRLLPKRRQRLEVIRHPPRLRWTCIRCGNSCRDIGERKRNILLTARDLGRITNETKMEPRRFSISSRTNSPYTKKMRKIGGSCFFLKGTKCTIYNARPLICRFYPFSLVRSENGEVRIGFDPACSGIGKGNYCGNRFYYGLTRLAREELSQE